MISSEKKHKNYNFFEILPGIQAVLDGFLTVLSPSITIIKYI